jgi:hypothetical protein
VTYSDWEQRQMDIASGEEMDRRGTRCPCCNAHGAVAYAAPMQRAEYACNRCVKECAGCRERISKARPDLVTT